LLVTPYHNMPDRCSLTDFPTELLIEVISPSQVLSRNSLSPVMLRSDVPNRQARSNALSSSCLLCRDADLHWSSQRLLTILVGAIGHLPAYFSRVSCRVSLQPRPFAATLIFRYIMSVPLASPRFYHSLQNLRSVHVSIRWSPTQVKAISLLMEFLRALPISPACGSTYSF
jgi:hypothetical protein